MSAGQTSDQPSGRLLDIDRAKGFAIALVVWGHIYLGTPASPPPQWMEDTRGVIYSFHMPFFMYLSGFVYFMTSGPDRFLKAPAAYIGKRFDRLNLSSSLPTKPGQRARATLPDRCVQEG